MATVIDELITKFTLDDKSYASGAHHIVEATHKATEAFEKANEKAKEFAKSIGERFKFGELIAPLAALGTLTGLVELGKDAVETAKKFDVLERKLAGVTASYKKAKEIMEFGEKEAGRTGLFDPGTLDEAAIALERFGLVTQKYLPVVEALSAVTGSGLDEFADALGMIANGEGERALRILERAGISKQMLTKKGVQFEKDTNKIISPPNQAITAIGSAVNEKYGGVLTEMMNSPEAKAARLSVAWEGAMRKVGTAIQSGLLPVVTSLTEGLDSIGESGQLDRIVAGFSNLFSLDGTDLKTIIKDVANFLELAPKKIRAFGNEIKTVFEKYEPTVIEFGKIWVALFAVEKVLEFGKVVSGVYSAVTKAIAAAAGAQITLDVATGAGAVIAVGAIAAGVAAYEALTAGIDEATNAVKNLGLEQEKTGKSGESAARAALKQQIIDLSEKRAQFEQSFGKGFLDPEQTNDVKKMDAQIASLLKQYKKLTAQDKAEEEKRKRAQAEADRQKQAAQDALNKLTNPDTQYLQQIAENTKQSAMDLKKYALGGGDLGRLGVTATEMTGIRGAQSHLTAVGGHIGRNVMDSLNAMINDQINRALADYLRRGLGRGQ